jgi:hypothetical protein
MAEMANPVHEIGDHNFCGCGKIDTNTLMKTPDDRATVNDAYDRDQSLENGSRQQANWLAR